MRTAALWLPFISRAPTRKPASLAPATSKLTLGQLRAGHRAHVAEVRHQGELGERLMEMGLVAGTEVEVVRRGRWGGVVQLGVRGYVLSLRHEDAGHIVVNLPPG